MIIYKLSLVLNSGFSAYITDVEREHELSAHSRKVRKLFSLSKSFTE